MTPAEGELGTYHQWLAIRPEEERLRDISRCKRIVAGIETWPLQWMRTDGVVCYTDETGVLDPRTTAKAPVARERQFWILTRKD